MSLANTHAAVIEHLIMFADRFFPGEVIALEMTENNLCYDSDVTFLDRLLRDIFESSVLWITSTAFALERGICR